MRINQQYSLSYTLKMLNNCKDSQLVKQQSWDHTPGLSTINVWILHLSAIYAVDVERKTPNILFPAIFPSREALKGKEKPRHIRYLAKHQ